MVKLLYNSKTIFCELLMIFQNGLLFPHMPFGKKLHFDGFIESYHEQHQFTEKVLFIDNITIDILYKVSLNKNVKVILTKQTHPIDVSFDGWLPIICVVPTEIHFKERQNATIEVDLSKYSKSKLKNMQVIFPKKHSRNNVILYLKKDFDMVKSFLKIPAPLFTNIVLADNSQDLKSLTGRNSSFAYRCSLIGIFYQMNSSRSTIHEYSHILLNQIGNPPLVLVEGMATLITGLLLENNSRKSFDWLAKRFLTKDPTQTFSKQLEGNYSPYFYHISLYYISASFLYFIMAEYGLEKLLLCYEKLSRHYPYVKNKDIFFNIMGVTLEVAEKIWLDTILIDNDRSINNV